MAPRNEKCGVGESIGNRLRGRLGLLLHDCSRDKEYTDDELLLLEALDTIERLRWRDPFQVEAERIIKSAAAKLKETSKHE